MTASDSSSGLPSCSVIIATLERVDSLRVVLKCIDQQSVLPHEVIIAAAGNHQPVEALINEQHWHYPIRLLKSVVKSSAQQRNAAAAIATGEVLAFLDDDIEFANGLFLKLLANFSPANRAPGAIAARIKGEVRAAPGRMTRWYYQLQAGYSHVDYGGRLFGPGINCYPVFKEDSPDLVQSEWLPATCLFVRADLFHVTKFPAFAGYSFAEDVHLTARIAQIAPLYFSTHGLIEHHSLPSEFKSNHEALVSGKLHNMGVIAREVQKLAGWSLWWRWQLHRLFMMAATLRSHPPHWRRTFAGIWQSRL